MSSLPLLRRASTPDPAVAPGRAETVAINARADGTLPADCPACGYPEAVLRPSGVHPSMSTDELAHAIACARCGRPLAMVVGDP